MSDWTAKDGVSNSSSKYKLIVGIVDHMIRDGAHSLLAGHSLQVSRSIVSYLAHAYGMEPKKFGRTKGYKSTPK